MKPEALIINNQVFVLLQSKLASMSNDFKSVLEVRTEVRFTGTLSL